MLVVMQAEARKGLDQGGLPLARRSIEASGGLIGAGHNRREQNGDSSLHGETDAFPNTGRRHSHRNLIMVTTLGVGTLVECESRNFQGGAD
jgi:cytosine/creatinine deaminase